MATKFICATCILFPRLRSFDYLHRCRNYRFGAIEYSEALPFVAG